MSNLISTASANGAPSLPQAQLVLAADQDPAANLCRRQSLANALEFHLSSVTSVSSSSSAKSFGSVSSLSYAN